MLFIMGFAGLITAICALWPNPMTDAIARQMGHVSWNGLTQHDTIFPLFLFIAGVSFPFSLSKQRASGISERRILFKVIRRGMTLIVLGMIYNGLFRFDFASLRVASVLGRIGLAWMFASLLYMYCKVRTRAVFAAVVLIGYSLLMYLVVAPDAPDGTDPLSVAGNIAGWVARQWLPGTFACGSFDPEGLLSTLPAIVSALFGMFTGEFLLRKRSSLSGEQIALCMALAAVAITVIGIIWNCWIPINKKLWSSSFTCVVTVDFFLPRNRVEFHHDLSGATNRRVRRHCEFLFRRGGFPLSRSDSTGDQQRRLCRHMLAVSLFSLPKKHILESLTHLKWPAVSSNTSQRSSAEISIKANYTGDWEILSSALRLIQNHKTNQKVKVLN